MNKIVHPGQRIIKYLKRRIEEIQKCYTKIVILRNNNLITIISFNKHDKIA